jgi:hypothetical protein
MNWWGVLVCIFITPAVLSMGFWLVCVFVEQWRDAFGKPQQHGPRQKVQCDCRLRILTRGGLAARIESNYY